MSATTGMAAYRPGSQGRWWRAAVAPRSRHALLVLAACAGLIGCKTENLPITSAGVTIGETLTVPETQAKQPFTVTFEPTASGTVQVRAWSLGPLVEVTLTLKDANGVVGGIKDRVGRGTGLLIDGVVVTRGKRYTLTAVWGQGKGVASYRVDALAGVEAPSQPDLSKDGTLAVARSGHTATRLPDGTVLVTGGIAPSDEGGLAPTKAAERVDPVLGTSVAASPLEQARTAHAAVLLDASAGDAAGKVLIVGGLGPTGDALATYELFDSKTGTFAGGSLPEGRAHHALLPVKDIGTPTFLGGKVLIVGGERTRGLTQHVLTLNQQTGEVEGKYREIDENPRQLLFFDPATGGVQGPSNLVLERGRVRPGVVQVGSRVLIIGGGVDALPSRPGCTQRDDNVCFCSAGGVNLCTELNCPKTATFSECTATSTVRKDLATDVVEVYELASKGDAAVTVLRDAFGAQAKLQRPRVGPAVHAMDDGRVFVAGGATAFLPSFRPNEYGLPETPVVVGEVEMLDPTDGQFHILAPLAVPRAYGALVQATDALLLVGGERGPAIERSGVPLVERLDTSKRQFLIDATFLDLPMGATVTVVRGDNGLLAIGGETAEGTPSNRFRLVMRLPPAFNPVGGSADATTTTDITGDASSDP